MEQELVLFASCAAYTTLHYTTLHYTTLHYTTLHYTTLHYTTLHYTTLWGGGIPEILGGWVASCLDPGQVRSGIASYHRPSAHYSASDGKTSGQNTRTQRPREGTSR